jgi:hypothetical protein
MCYFDSMLPITAYGLVGDFSGLKVGQPLAQVEIAGVLLNPDKGKR